MFNQKKFSSSCNKWNQVPCTKKKRNEFYLKITLFVGHAPTVVKFLAFCAMAERVAGAGPAVSAVRADEAGHQAGDARDEELLHHCGGLRLLGARRGLAPHTNGVLLKREKMLNE